MKRCQNKTDKKILQAVKKGFKKRHPNPIKERCFGSKKPRMQVIMPREKFQFSIVDWALVDWDNLEETFVNMDSLYETDAHA